MITHNEDEATQRCTACGAVGHLPADTPENNAWPMEETLITGSDTPPMEQQLIQHAAARAALAQKGITWNTATRPPGPLYLSGPASTVGQDGIERLALPARLQFIADFAEKHGRCKAVAGQPRVSCMW